MIWKKKKEDSSHYPQVENTLNILVKSDQNVEKNPRRLPSVIKLKWQKKALIPAMV